MSYLIDLFVFALMTIKYVVAYCIWFNKKVKRVWILPLVIVGIALFLLHHFSQPDVIIRIVIHVCIIVMMIFFIPGEWKTRVGSMLDVFFLLCCIDQAGYTILKNLNAKLGFMREEDNAEYIIVGVFTLANVT